MRHLSLPLLLAALISLQAGAQNYPTRAIRMVVPFPPGGAGDTLARLVATPMSKTLGQNVVVESRTGANTVIATELVSRAPADGYTLLVMATSSAPTKTGLNSTMSMVWVQPW